MVLIHVRISHNLRHLPSNTSGVDNVNNSFMMPENENVLFRLFPAGEIRTLSQEVIM